MTSLVIAIALAGAGCARVQTEVTYSQALVNREVQDGVVVDSTTYRAAARLDGETLVVALRREATCRTTTTPVYARERHIHRMNAPTPTGYALSPATLFAVGAGLGGAGVYGIVDADSLAAQSGTDGTGSTSPNDYRYAGVVSAVAAAALITAAIVDSVRLRDSTEDAGQVRGEPARVDRACEQHPASHAAIQARTDRTDWLLDATTDADGEARLALHDLAEAAWQGDQLTVQLTIDDHRLPVEVDHAAQLRSMLAGDATTRIAKDREQRAQQACTDAVARVAEADADATTDLNALGETIDMLDRMERAARTACGERWQPGHDEQLAGFRSRVAAMQKTRARLEHRLGLANDLGTMFDEHDCVGLRAMVARDPQAVELLRTVESASAALLELARYWVGQLEAGDARARAQLCASRALVTRLVGAAAWSRLRAEVVRRGNVVAGARLASAMDAGSCR